MSTKLSLHVTVLVIAVALTVIGVLLMGTGTVAAQGPQPASLTGEPEGGAPVTRAAPQPAEDATAAANYQHVAGVVFQERYPTSQGAYGGNGCKYVTGVSPYLDYPVILPYKAHISEIRLYFKDTNLATNGILRLERFDDGAALLFQVAVTTTSNSGLGVATVPADVTLDYDNYSYVMFWDPGGIVDGSLQLCGYRIGYTAPNLFGAAMPQILR